MGFNHLVGHGTSFFWVISRGITRNYCKRSCFNFLKLFWSIDNSILFYIYIYTYIIIFYTIFYLIKILIKTLILKIVILQKKKCIFYIYYTVIFLCLQVLYHFFIAAWTYFYKAIMVYEYVICTYFHTFLVFISVTKWTPSWMSKPL